MKKALSVLLVFCICFGFGGCSSKNKKTNDTITQSPSEKQSQPSETMVVPKPIIVTHILEPDNPDNFYIYRCDYDYSLEKRIYYPIPYKPEKDIDATVLQEVFFEYRCGNISGFDMTISGNTATIGLVDGSDDPESLASIWATITQNCKKIKRVVFLRYSKPYVCEVTNENGEFLPEPLNPPILTMDELEALRKTIPYEFSKAEPWDPIYPVIDDDLSRSLADFIYSVTYINGAEPSFSNINEAGNGFILMAGMMNTAQIGWSPENTPYATELREYPELSPLVKSSHEMQGWLKEHIEITARILFGEDVKLNHNNRDAFPWRYDIYGGVYVPIGIGIHGKTMPVILEYTDLGDRYETTVVFLSSHAGDGWEDMFGNALKQNQIAEYCLTRLPRHKITIKKAPDDSFNYYAHELPANDFDINASLSFYSSSLKIDLDSIATIISDVIDYERATQYIGDPDVLTLDDDGQSFLIFPNYTGSTVRIDELDDMGNIQKVLHEGTLTAEQAMCSLYLTVRTGKRNPDIRVTIERNGKQASWIISDDSMTPPENIQVFKYNP